MAIERSLCKEGREVSDEIMNLLRKIDGKAGGGDSKK
jgi:hypothetical protein